MNKYNEYKGYALSHPDYVFKLDVINPEQYKGKEPLEYYIKGLYITETKEDLDCIIIKTPFYYPIKYCEKVDIHIPIFKNSNIQVHPKSSENCAQRIGCIIKKYFVSFKELNYESDKDNQGMFTYYFKKEILIDIYEDINKED